MKSILLFLSIFKLVTSVLGSDVILTKSGPVQGTTVNNSFGNQFVAYTGIPFAEPPVGPLRFKPPVPVKPWTDVLQKSNFKLCIQQVIPGFAQIQLEANATSEDCLTLNIMVPSPTPKKAPVLVFVHGGAFSVGRALRPDGSLGNIVSEENLILVSMNYRLNIFGFMSLGTSEAPGNLGIMDQRLALGWVKENIEAFGGDPNSITLMGLSAGSTSICYHIFANQIDNLFHRAILMSGVASDAGHTEPEHIVSKTMNLATAVGCSSKDVNTILKCLTNITAEDLITADNRLRTDAKDFFRPTVDGIYVTEDPRISIEAGRFGSVPVLVGITSNEGGRFAYMHNRELFTGPDDTLSPESFQKIVNRLLEPYANRATFEAAKLFYSNFSNPDDPVMLRDAAAQAYGDYIFVCGVNTFCNNYAESGNTVYMYVYDQKIDALTGSSWSSPDHSSDVPVVLGLALGSPILSAKDAEFSRQLMNHWGNFIRTGDPNGPGNYFPLWPKYNLVHKSYMRLTYSPQVQGHFKATECSFWNVLFPNLKTAHKCLTR